VKFKIVIKFIKHRQRNFLERGITLGSIVSAQKLRIKDKMKYLYIKKQQLNRQLYHLLLTLANTCNTCPYIQHMIEEKLEKTVQVKYKNLDDKLNGLIRERTTTPRVKHTFYPRVINNTNITFSNNEITFLS